MTERPGAGSAALYTPDLLGLAVSLAAYPLTDDLDLRGHATSRTCGSQLVLGCTTDSRGMLDKVGVRASACAVGQAAAALFVQSAPGKSRADIAASRETLVRWLEGTEPAPVWPGIERLAAAADRTSRHGAILLAWDAALAALPKA